MIFSSSILLEFEINDVKEDTSSSMIFACDDEDDVDIWIHEINKAKSQFKPPKLRRFTKPSLQLFIGSMELAIVSLDNIPIKKGKRNIAYAVEAKIGYHEEKMIPLIDQRGIAWKKTAILPVHCFRDELELQVYQERAYSVPLIIGIARLPLDFLEYFQGKKTDVMKVALKNPHSPESNYSASIQISYKHF